ncbi:MAG TPA: archaemetzincin family Zn-dependent metalloprotease [Terriglobales bacterium]|nr:archaemetzincin family Zn-dependent metalloprotease [Terriglobales bacterium]
MREQKPQFNQRHSLVVTLLPCGTVDASELGDLAQALRAKGMLVNIAHEKSIPARAFESRRQQYRADEFLKVARSEPGDRVLTVTNCDLYADNLNFVFGLASSFGKCAVISLCRLRIAVDQETFRRRVAKEAVHELGHTLGLAHCAKPSCVMHFSNSLQDTDRKSCDWCERCQKKLQADPEPASSSKKRRLKYGYLGAKGTTAE